MIYDYILGCNCSSNIQQFDFLLDYIAHFFKKPEEKPQKALFICGNQGSGKGLFVSILEDCLGPYACYLVGMKKFHSYINTFQSSTQFLVTIDECEKLNEVTLNMIKDVITSSSREYGLKAKSTPVMNPLYFRFIIISIDENVIKMCSTERRYFALNTCLREKSCYSSLTKFIGDHHAEICETFIYEMFHRDIIRFSPYETLVTDFQSYIMKKRLVQTKEQSLVSFFKIRNGSVLQG